MSVPFDPASYSHQLAEKATRLRELLAPFDAPEPQLFESPQEHYRLRAEFRNDLALDQIVVNHK